MAMSTEKHGQTGSKLKYIHQRARSFFMVDSSQQKSRSLHDNELIAMYNARTHVINNRH